MKTVVDVRQSPRVIEMRRLVTDHLESGLTIAEFARQRNVKASLIWRWRQRFGLTRSAGPQEFVPVNIVDDSQRARKSETAGRNNDSLASWTVETRDGRRIGVPIEFDDEQLRRLIKVVEPC